MVVGKAHVRIGPHRRHLDALSLFGAVVIFACIVLLGGLLLKILLKACDKLPPPTHPGLYDTNLVSMVSQLRFDSVPAQIAMPAFTFSETEIASIDAQSFANEGSFLIERSTNLIDWSPCWRISAMSEFNFAGDTNPIAPMCFYRAVLIP